MEEMEDFSRKHSFSLKLAMTWRRVLSAVLFDSSGITTTSTTLP